ncbi:MAG: iron export ABC transporter permease subunit FetB [Coriobacteriia bacterium]|nr:iron export ABC transporter permease subunit FetB [Coriobacteriia bacterium]
MNELGVITVSPLHLALASGFIIVTAVVLTLLKLGITRQYLFAAARAAAQLLFLGFVLAWIFELESVLPVLGVIAFMTGVAAFTVARRNPSAPRSVMPIAFIVLLSVSFIIVMIVANIIIGIDPWFDPRYFIPLAGLILGNSMSGVAIALERMFNDLDTRTDEIRSLVALGATPWECARSSVRDALRAGIIPNINTLSAIGLVFIPGIMSGQVLAGINPAIAAPYQIIVSFMISAGDSACSAIVTLWMYRYRFADNGMFLDPSVR